MRNYERRARIEALFEAALDRPDDDRADWLESECAGDPELLAEVHALLAAHELADRLFPEPEPPAGGGRIGPYRVLRELGRGGMGVVYLAERDDGQFRRRVAIKLVGTRDTEDPIHQRFLAERQILAGLDHPNIARLLDGGLSEDGRPYLVLEYVEGLPITMFCDRHGLGIEERLRLFVRVCEAVQHAHQNLVIHRDLKPSNIMVTSAGQVRLLDFGIAKLLNPSLSSVPSPTTRVDLRAMTPEYASPEQVRGEALTTASDIYSLGVLLYELLTGSRPYPLDAGSTADVVAAVCERDPERPSTRVPQLRGDLDSIILMALRKEPGRRFASAALMAQDIQRHLDGEPVLAHRGTRRYHLGKLIRRHRGATVATALVFHSLILGLGAALWQASVAHQERERADRARAEAERALEQSEEVTDFLTGLFAAGSADPTVDGGQVTARDLLRRGAARADELASHPEAQARLLDVTGQMYRQLGHYDDAQRHLERAVAIRRELGAPASPDLASSLIHLSWVHRSRGDRAQALRLAKEALEVRRAVLPADHPDVGEAVYQVGRVTGDAAEAERLYREAFDLLQRTGGHPERQVALLQGLSTFARRDGRFEEAIATDEEALRLATRLFGPDDHRTGHVMVHLADHVRDLREDYAEAERLYREGMERISRRHGDYHTDLIHGLSSLAWLKSQLDQHEEAEQLHRRAMAIRVAATGAEDPLAAAHLNSLAGALERAGRLDEAEALARQALDIWSVTFGPRHRLVGSAMPRLASILFHQGRLAEADEVYRTAITVQLEAADPAPILAAETRREHGRMLIAVGRHAEAEAELLASLSTLEERQGPDHPNTRETKRALAQLYEAWGQPERAAPYRVPPGRFIAY